MDHQDRVQRPRGYHDPRHAHEQRIKEPVSRQAMQFLKREAFDGLSEIPVVRGEKVEQHFWQPGRGHDRNITNSQTLQKLIGSIPMNPVRQGLVEQARDWKWSSAGWFEQRSLHDLEPDPIPRDWLEERLSIQ